MPVVGRQLLGIGLVERRELVPEGVELLFDRVGLLQLCRNRGSGRDEMLCRLLAAIVDEIDFERAAAVILEKRAAGCRFPNLTGLLHIVLESLARNAKAGIQCTD